MARRNKAAQGGVVVATQCVASARRARACRVRLPLVRHRDRALDFEGPHSPRRRLELLRLLRQPQRDQNCNLEQFRDICMIIIMHLVH